MRGVSAREQKRGPGPCTAPRKQWELWRWGLSVESWLVSLPEGGSEDFAWLEPPGESGGVGDSYHVNCRLGLGCLVCCMLLFYCSISKVHLLCGVGGRKPHCLCLNSGPMTSLLYEQSI